MKCNDKGRTQFKDHARGSHSHLWVLASSFSSEKRLRVKIEELEFVISENSKPFRRRYKGAAFTFHSVSPLILHPFRLHKALN